MKRLVVGADPFPPYQYINNDGKICGIDYDVVSSIINMMGYEAKYIIKKWMIIKKMFDNEEIDVLFQVQKTPEREKRYYFSEKLRDAVTLIVTSTNNTHYRNVDDLLKDNGKLAVEKNYQYGEIIDSIDKNNKVYFQSLNNGEEKYGVVDLKVFEYLNKNNLYNNIKIINNLHFNRSLYVIFNDKSLRDRFNYFLKIL